MRANLPHISTDRRSQFPPLPPVQRLIGLQGLTDRGTCVVVYAGYEEDMHELPLVYLRQTEQAEADSASGDEEGKAEDEGGEEGEDDAFAGLGDGLADEEEDEEEDENGALEAVGGAIGQGEPHSSLAGSPFGLEKITEGEAEAEMDTVDDVTTTTAATNDAGKMTGKKGKLSKKEAEKEARERKLTEAAAAVKVRASIHRTGWAGIADICIKLWAWNHDVPARACCTCVSLILLL